MTDLEGVAAVLYSMAVVGEDSGEALQSRWAWGGWRAVLGALPWAAEEVLGVGREAAMGLGEALAVGLREGGGHGAWGGARRGREHSVGEEDAPRELVSLCVRSVPGDARETKRKAVGAEEEKRAPNS